MEAEILDIGLSLCIQGTFDKKREEAKKERFIPVYTGNILLSSITYLSVAVYPCVYREHLTVTDCRVLTGGLSLCIQGT